MSDKDKSDALYRKHLRIMIFINICPIFHWMRNNRRILNYYYYICLTEFEKVKDKDSEILDMLYHSTHSILLKFHSFFFQSSLFSWN